MPERTRRPRRKLSEVASRGPISDAKWTMSRSAARAFMAGRGVALGVGVVRLLGSATLRRGWRSAQVAWCHPL